MSDKYKIISGLIIIVVAISLPVTIFLVTQPQSTVQQAAQKTVEPTAIISSCPETNPDGTTNTCRPDPYCMSGEKIKFDGNEACSKILEKDSSCCTKRR